MAGEQAEQAPADGTPEQASAAGGAAVYRLVEIGKAESLPQGTVVANAFEPEDEFARHYLGMEKDAGLIQPPYNLKMLDRLCQENNALGPCVEAMVTNVDGTGYVFEAEGEEEQDTKDDHKVAELEDFFAEVWPGESFQTLRRRLRRDQERTGNAYLEVVRNPPGEIVFLRHVDTKMIRLVKLDEPIAVDKTVIRRGKPVTIAVAMRERRFAQMIGHKLVYFKEFGARRDLDKVTGKWAARGQRLPAQRRASELIHLTKYPDAHTPYGVPSWIAQTPSVLGSRKAEEFNLEFFENGGVPPILILIQGGLMADKTRKAIEQRLHGPAKKANRVQVIEADPTGGSLDHPGNTRITVERFGAERQSDCHDAATEVLTPGGWVSFPELEPGIAVATLNPNTRRMEYQVPDALVSYPYEGSLVRITGSAVDLCVTPEHDLWLRTRSGSYAKIKAGAYDGRRAWMTTAGQADEEQLTSVFIPKYKKRIDDPEGSVELPADTLLELIGLYVGDGCVPGPGSRSYGIRLGARSQLKVEHFRKSLQSVAEHLEADVRSYALDGGGFSIEMSSKSLCLWLREHCGAGARSKKLPDWCLRLNAMQSHVLLSALFLADGSQCHGRQAWAYRSASAQLAEQVQGVAVRTGHRATLRKEKDDYWRVNIVPGTPEVCVEGVAREPYAGFVYCVRVPNHLVFTRRNGCVVVSGNSMFEKYDERCEVRVRRSFRLPPIFVGQSSDYSFATAFVSYTVTEAQVFKPEREEFDEIITIKLLPAMGYGGYRLRSLPLTIEGIENKLKGLEIANTTNRVDPADVVHAVNEVTGLKLKVTDKPVVPPVLPGAGTTGMAASGVPKGTKRPAVSKAEPDPDTGQELCKTEGILALATDTVLAMRRRDMAGLQENLQLALELAEPDQRAYRQALATCQFADPGLDLDGLGELAGCVCAVLHANADSP